MRSLSFRSQRLKETNRISIFYLCSSAVLAVVQKQGKCVSPPHLSKTAESREKEKKVDK